MTEACDLLVEQCSRLEQQADRLDQEQRRALQMVLQGQDARQFLGTVRQDLLQERADIPTLQRTINLLLVKLHHDHQSSRQLSGTERSQADAGASVC